MKKFLNYSLIFITLVITFFTSLFFITKKIVIDKTNYKIEKSIDKIIIGHSHSECAFNDSLVNNCKNISASADSYFYSYYKLMTILNNNNNIKTIFVEFSNNQLTQQSDKWTWDDKYLPFKYQVYGTFINKEGFNFLLNKNPKGLFAGQIKMLRQNIKIITTSHYNYLYNRGGYLYLTGNNLKNELENQLKDNSNDKKDSIISESNLIYLEKILSFCKEKNIKVYFIRSPMHNKYNGIYNELILQNICKTRFRTIEFLDFKDYPLEDSDFSDLEHLNYRGAKKFSIWFNKLLIDSLLEKSNKQQFINENMIR